VVPFADAADVGRLAEAAERAGWDGLFVWEPVWGVDAWVSLAVTATRTERLRPGTLLTPLPRRQPWELTGQVATVNQLSDGRGILSVGLGPPDTGEESFGLETDRRTRAERLDEGLDVLDVLWRSQPATYEGRRLRRAAAPGHRRQRRPPGHARRAPRGRRRVTDTAGARP
jgi:alkanesulfonate monooxygenase SsuD/methylene tetrahydromethanopterin reductase-like flavin-dependent oxidoreductase (luciferase family)